MSSANSKNPPTFCQALSFWIRLGLISFGGPAGQISIMHQEIVERRKWLSESHFLHALNFCMLLPGPEAQQLATYLGWRLHGWRGGITAGSLFVLPSALILFFLSWLYIAGGHLPWLASIFYGLLPAVIAIIGVAIMKIGGKALHSPSLWAIAAASFIAIYFYDISFVVIIFGAALIGYLGYHKSPTQFTSGNFPSGKITAPSENTAIHLHPSPKATIRRALTITATCLFLWSLPIISLALWLGWESTPVAQGMFFTKASLVTFGGAYAVLPYVAQQAVENYSWLSHPQMMSGLALAETTPGPLIIVLQFVGFVGGWQHPGNLSSLAAASIGAFITTWSTFIPCFLFVFLGAPYVEKLRTLPRIAATLTAVTAAVVGVILNLGVSFFMHAVVSISKDPTTQPIIDYYVLGIATVAFIAMSKFHTPFTIILPCCALLGLATHFL